MYAFYHISQEQCAFSVHFHGIGNVPHFIINRFCSKRGKNQNFTLWKNNRAIPT